MFILSLQPGQYLEALEGLLRPGDTEDLVADDLHQPQLPSVGLARLQLATGSGLSEEVCDGGIPGGRQAGL